MDQNELKNFASDLNQALSSFIGEKNVDEVRTLMKSKILYTLQQYGLYNDLVDFFIDMEPNNPSSLQLVPNNAYTLQLLKEIMASLETFSGQNE